MRRVLVQPWEVLQLRGARPVGFCVAWMVAATVGIAIPIVSPELGERIVWRAGEGLDLVALLLSPITWGAPDHIEIGPYIVSMGAMWTLGTLVCLTRPPQAIWWLLAKSALLGIVVQALLFPFFGDVFFAAHYVPLALSYAVIVTNPGRYVAWGTYALGTTNVLRWLVWLGLLLSMVAELLDHRSIVPTIGSAVVLLAVRATLIGGPLLWLPRFPFFGRGRARGRMRIVGGRGRRRW